MINGMEFIVNSNESKFKLTPLSHKGQKIKMHKNTIKSAFFTNDNPADIQ